MAKRTTGKSAISSPGNTTQSAFEVSYEPQPEQALKNMPQAVRQELDEIYESLSRNATEAVPRLQELKKRYPKVMLINNYLAVAYGYIDKRQQDQVIKENYQNNKTYLFARCHYAQLCMAKGESEKIPGIFDNKLDLKSLYPRRSRFHITEYLAFTLVRCLYYHATGNSEQAESEYQAIVKAAPDSDEARQAKQALHPGLMARFFKRLQSTLTD